IVCVDAQGLAPHAAGLRLLEAAASYPTANDRFRIDHGERYDAFFAHLGEPRFLVALEDERVVGTLALVRRAPDTLYAADLKVAPEHRGTGLARRLVARALWAFARERALRGARFGFFAAMRGERGDVTRSARGLSA